MSAPQKKERVLAGIRASGQPHIGNYLGAMKQFVELQETHDCFFFIADLHSLTTPFEPDTQRMNALDVALDYLALGLDPEKCTLFLQSQVSEHAELAWILNCITPLGELERMTQFKDKANSVKTESINAGLLNYPVLMAADILLYKPSSVPVGEDQIQHTELTRTIARKFNTRFGNTFPLPKNLTVKETARIKSLTDPDKKMSKSGDEALLINDSPEEIHRKIKKAVTSTETNGKAPGVENLLQLLEQFGGETDVTRFSDAIADGSIKYSELKELLADRIIAYFAPFRERRAALAENPHVALDALAEGARKAKEVAAETMREVKSKIGLL
jgi:tryptophanyl-tRNA synthetase